MVDSVSRTFTRYVYSLNFESLPPEVVDKIKTSLLHSLIIAIVGGETSHGRAAVTLAKDDGATILLDGARVTRAGDLSHPPSTYQCKMVPGTWMSSRVGSWNGI